MGTHADFYEEDEPLQDVIRAFEEGEPFVTRKPQPQPQRGWNEILDVPGLKGTSSNPLVRMWDSFGGATATGH
jgi:hypothetical protein